MKIYAKNMSFDRDVWGGAAFSKYSVNDPMNESYKDNKAV